jgi:hypothetical protein
MKQRIANILWWTGMAVMVAIIVWEAIGFYDRGMW